MANRIPNTLVSTAVCDINDASKFDTGTNTADIHSTTNITVSTSAVFSANFTAPNLVNGATSLLVFLVSKAASGSPTTITATLQENLAGTFNDTAHTQTITLASVNANEFIHFRPAAPYVFMTTTASRYRWKLVCDTGTVTVAANAAGTTFAYVSGDNRNVAPTTSDWVPVVGINDAGPVTVRLVGSPTFGNGSGSLGTPSGSTRLMRGGVVLANGGKLTADQAGNVTATINGEILIGMGGEHEDGTSGARLSSSYKHEYIFNDSNGNGGTVVFDYGKAKMWATEKINWRARTVGTGLGTAASPMITDGDIGEVNDQVLIAPSSNDATNYNQTEPRFIITKNSATSYVLSTTMGGAEAALTHSHPTGTRVANVSKNIIMRGQSTAVNAHFHYNNQTNTGNVEVDSVRYENIGGALFFGVAQLNFVGFGNNCVFNKIVAYQGLHSLLTFGSFSNGTVAISSDARTVTGNILYSTVASAANSVGALSLASQSGKTINDTLFMGFPLSNLYASADYSNELNDCEFYAGNTSNTAAQGGLLLGGSGVIVLNDCEFHANRNGVMLNVAPNIVFNRGKFGTRGENKNADVTGVTGTYNTAIFNETEFGSPTMITNYLNFAAGSEIRFHKINNVENNHRWYTIYGKGRTEQTVIRSPGLSVALEPENLATGFTWQFQVPVNANSQARFAGFFMKNAALGTGVTTVSVYLPGNPVSGGSPDVMATLDNTTGAAFADNTEQSVDIGDFYAGDIPGAVEVVVNVKSNTPGAVLYCDDFFNAGNRSVTIDEITGLNLWVEGKPLSVISPSVPSAADNAAATWNYLLANMTLPGSAGWLLKKLLTVRAFLSRLR